MSDSTSFGQSTPVLLPLSLLLLSCCVPVLGFVIVDTPPNGTDILQNCPHSFVLLSDADNYTLLENGTAVMFEGKYFNVSFYSSFGNSSGPVICLRLPPNTQPSPSRLFTVLLLTVLCFSIIASITLLITYSLFRKLRTLPGKVIMNLGIAFLAGDAGYLIFVVALSEVWFLIVVFYFFYARFMWMALAGFEICRNVYSGLKLLSDSENRKNKFLLAYFLIGWGVPFLPTTVTAVVHYTSSSPETQLLFGIGGHVIYLVPIGLTVLFNTGTVVFLSVALHKAAVRQKQFESAVTKRHTTNYGRVFLIILTALGFTWISLFVILSNTQNVVIIGTIMLINGSQPIFVCVAFIGTKKVIKEYLRLCRCQKKKKEVTLSRGRSLNRIV